MTDLETCFDTFTSSVFRLETLQFYDADDVRFAAWQKREPLPEVSVRTSAWLRRIALTTAAGKSWQRVHVVDHPLTEYLRFELAAYVESAATGEEVRIADRAASTGLAPLRQDFWLFDAGTPAAAAALMHYDDRGGFVSAEVTSEPGVLRTCEAWRDLAVAHSVSLNVYLARQRSA